MKAQPEAKIEPRDPEPHTGDSQMTKRIAGLSPRFKARMAGVFELLEGLTSAGGQVVILGSLVVAGNAATTAANILAHEPLFWLGFASSLIAVAFHLAWALLFYDLFKPVNRGVSLLATFVILVGCAMQALTSLLYLAPLLVLQGGSSLSAFAPQQLQALALVFLNLNAQAFEIYLVFFGLWCVLIGYLIFRSTFLPRILGVLLVIDGLGWMLYLSPPLAQQVFPFIAVASGLAEIPLMLWLLVVGVNAERWKEQASAAGGVPPHMKAAFSTRDGPAFRSPGFVQPYFSPTGAREHCPVSVLRELFFALWLLMKGCKRRTMEKTCSCVCLIEPMPRGERLRFRAPRQRKISLRLKARRDFWACDDPNIYANSALRILGFTFEREEHTR